MQYKLFIGTTTRQKNYKKMRSKKDCIKGSNLDNVNNSGVISRNQKSEEIT